jgi:hypothetical protein
MSTDAGEARRPLALPFENIGNHWEPALDGRNAWRGPNIFITQPLEEGQLV